MASPLMMFDRPALKGHTLYTKKGVSIDAYREFAGKKGVYVVMIEQEGTLADGKSEAYTFSYHLIDPDPLPDKHVKSAASKPTFIEEVDVDFLMVDKFAVNDDLRSFAILVIAVLALWLLFL